MGIRLETLVSCVPPCRRVVDVGCDHGYTSLMLARRGDVSEIFATDISASSLDKLVRQLPFEKEADRARIHPVVCDGLHGLPCRDAEVLLIAGMGGDLILRILDEEEPFVSRMARLVLSPHTAADRVRKYLRAHGFCIVEEHPVWEEGHYYDIIVAEPQSETEAAADDPMGDRYGRLAIENRDPVLHRRLQDEQRALQELIEKLTPKLGTSEHPRIGELKRERDALSRLLKEWDK